MPMRMFLRGILPLLLMLAAGTANAADPAKVIVGTFVNQILDLSFKELICVWVVVRAQR